MAELRTEVERIVREVLAQVMGGAVQQSACACAAKPAVATSAPLSPAPLPPAPPKAEKPQRTSRSEELALTNRVITLADLEGRLAAVRRVVVPAKAIVTPAVRDELQRRGVALSFARPQAASISAMPRLATVIHHKCCPASLPVSAGEGFAVEASATDCIFEAVDRLAAEIASPGVAGLLLTRHTAAALCLANRHSGVRAVWGADAASLAESATAVGANLLVVDPAEASLFRLKRLLAEFRRAPRECPKVFAARLN